MRHLRDPENICAAVLIVAFFLPWVTFFGIPAAGYQLSEFGGRWWLVWALPALCLGVIASGVLEVRRPWLSIAVGLVPLAGLLYLLAKLGGAVFDLLHVGGYITLLAGLALIAAALAGRRAKRAAEAIERAEPLTETAP